MFKSIYSTCKSRHLQTSMSFFIRFIYYSRFFYIKDFDSGSLAINFVVVSFTILMICLMILICKVKALNCIMCQKEKNSLCWKWSQDDCTTRMNFKPKTNVNTARQQNTANRIENYCNPWEVTSNVWTLKNNIANDIQFMFSCHSKTKNVPKL